MAVIKCKMCGGDIELSADKTFGVCECCGSTMTFPKLDDDQRAAAFNRGNYFRRIGEFDKALAVYERIVQEDETDAEAHWCCALCRYGIEYVEDPATHEYLPTCHRASFDSFLEDVDYKAALQYSDGITKRQYEKDAAKIAEVQHGILATCQNEQPFDVFICYKESDENGNRTKDSTLAQEIYYQLTDQGLRVFFARITLEDKGGTEYEPYIFAALNSAKVMVVVGTKPEYFSAVWVKNEWSRFLAMMKKDRSKLLLPCYRDMNPYDLPEALSVLQSYDMAKIGFMQDLTRGIGKVLDAGKPATAKQETVVVQNIANTNVTAQVKRGNLALADGDWEQASTFFNQALDMDAECAEAYLGLALAEAKETDFSAFARHFLDSMQNAEAKMVDFPFRQQAEQQLKEESLNIVEKLTALYGETYSHSIDGAFEYKQWRYETSIEAKKELLLGLEKYCKHNTFMSKAIRFTKTETPIPALENLKQQARQIVIEQEKTDAQVIADGQKRYENFYAEVEERVEEKQKELLDRLERDYQAARQNEGTAKTKKEWMALAGKYAELDEYKDAKEKAVACKQRAKSIKKKALIRNIAIIAGIVLVAAIELFYVNVIEPANKYKNAESLFAAGDYTAAQTAFEALGDYKDAAVRAHESVQEGVYQQANIYYADGESAQAVETFWQVGDYKDSLEKICEIYPELQLIDLKQSSYQRIYPLDNAIPCGLLNQSITYDKLLEVKGNYKKKGNNTITYGDYSLYGYSCEVRFLFNQKNLLQEIDVIGPETEKAGTFTDDDFNLIESNIKSKLSVNPQLSASPEISHGNEMQYTFKKNGIQYKMDNGLRDNVFRIKISLKK